MKISEIITDKYKLRIPPTVYYNLLSDVEEVEEKQEPILDKIKAEIVENSIEDYEYEPIIETSEVLRILDKYKVETEGT